MNRAPRIEIDLDKVFHNASTLVGRLAKRGIAVTGVTKGTLGSADVAATFVRAGIRSLGDSRIENIQRMRAAGVRATMMLLRSPMLSEVDRAVLSCDVSHNTEVEVVRALSVSAQSAGVVHSVVLMVELGDLREGIMPGDLSRSVLEIIDMPNIALKGIGANLACRNGVVPDDENMAVLSSLADELESAHGIRLETVSGGSSASLGWALGTSHVGRINELRLGESILLGVEPLRRDPIEGLQRDAFTIVAEVIESKVKPSLPWGLRAQNAFGETPVGVDRGLIPQSVLALGRQDTDPDGLTPLSEAVILGSSSDHLIVESALPVGAEVSFRPNYSALLRAMTSPYVAEIYSGTLVGAVQDETSAREG